MKLVAFICLFVADFVCLFTLISRTAERILMILFLWETYGPRLTQGLLCLPEKVKQKVKKGQKQVQIAFFRVFCPFQTIYRKVIGRCRQYLVDISQIHRSSVI